MQFSKLLLRFVHRIHSLKEIIVDQSGDYLNIHKMDNPRFSAKIVSERAASWLSGKHISFVSRSAGLLSFIFDRAFPYPINFVLSK